MEKMKIELEKNTAYQSQYIITRDDDSTEKINLETKTYFIHDMCHYVVERKLNYEKGFWGMLAKGYKFEQLFGKENSLTEELRAVEQIVGPIQSVYMGHFKKEQINMLTNYLDVKISDDILDECLDEIKTLVDQWEQLPIGDRIELEF